VLWPLCRLFLRLGFSGFGGPLAHIAMMETEAVERRGWLSKAQFMEGLALCQMLPGPASTQLGIYIGYLRAGLQGAILSGLAFILPGFAIITTLTWLYGRYGTLPQVQGMFTGINPAVVAIVAFACWRLGRSAITTLPLGLLAGAAFLATWLWRADAMLVLLAAGCVGLLLERTRGAAAGFGLLAIAPALPAAPTALPGAAAFPALDLAWLFFKAGAFVYGGGYVILPFVYREAVERYGWLDLRTFLDGIALGQITPGPIVNLSAFVGYQVGGLPGAALACAAVFLPAFAAILLAIPLMDRIRRAPAAQAFLRTVNAAVVGTILGATVPLAQGAIVGLPTGVIAVASLILLWRYRLDTFYLVLGGAVLGLLLSR